MTPVFALKPQEALSAFSSNLKGLSQAEATTRLGKYGLNKITTKSSVSPLSIFLNQFKNTLTIILLAATSLILFIYFVGERNQSDLIEAGLIFAIVILIAFLGFIQEYKAEKAVESLKKMLAFDARVRRDGHEFMIDVAQIVPGDIVILEEGMKVPADIRLLEVYQLKTNEASLTGESTSVNKSVDALATNTQISDQKNMIFSGTNIVSGRGIGIVSSTGNDTEIGKIAKQVGEAEEDETPLQIQLKEIGKKIGFLVIVICSIVFVFIMFFASEFSHLGLIEKIVQSFIAAVALAVAAIPEGLPAVVTISLALGTQRMLKKNALVKKLNSVETLGATDVICSDKTGTLTKGEMTVVEIHANKKHFFVTGTGYEKTGDFMVERAKVDAKELSTLLEIGAECNNSHLAEKILGDPTEAALIVSAAKAGIEKRLTRVFEIPFTSERKMMSVVVKKDEKLFVYTKGAPEILLAHVDMTEAEREEIKKVVFDMSTKALRTLGFAYRQISEEEFKNGQNTEGAFETNLKFAGVQGLIDPPRDEIKSLISDCSASGIRVIMVTGDHIETAKAVATAIGLSGDAKVGAELENLDDHSWESIVKTTNIYARVNPGVKMKIVEYLKREGHIVAMTGDGVNDAPALKRADIGIAMGVTGTDVAKEASDVILLDDHFKTIVAAIEEGRGIYQNIKKFVHYLLACNLAEVATVFLAIFLFREVPLSATMLLWINVVTDGLPAVALGLDPAPKDILKAKPKAFQGSIMSKQFWIDMAIFAFLLSVAVVALYATQLPHGEMSARSIAFLAIVIFEMMKLFMVRSMYKTPFFANKWLFIAVVVTFSLQLIIMYVPFLANIFEIENTLISTWLIVMTTSVLLWMAFTAISSVVKRFSKAPVVAGS